MRCWRGGDSGDRFSGTSKPTKRINDIMDRDGSGKITVIIMPDDYNEKLSEGGVNDEENR
ncbi:MAG: hypothetical protein DRP15_03450 [Candidatus Aenigmatarchaeota archaeon]|nr:MAG: hypothetical protein DRP15_03450 [Candidatus Aenigmarchaeota archaeon]